MKISQTFKSQYFRASDFGDEERALVIADVRTEEVGKDREIKPVMRFEDEEQGFVVNRSNGRVMATAWGDETDSWKGKTVILYTTLVSTPNGTGQGIRVRIP